MPFFENLGATKRPASGFPDAVINAAKEIQFELQLQWPEACPVGKRAELYFLTTTYHNFADYRRRLNAAYAASGGEQYLDGEYTPEPCPDPRLNGLLGLLWSNTPAERDFTVGWAEEVCRVAWAWDGWRGELKNWAWRRGHRRWAARIAEELRAFDGGDNYEFVMGVIYS